MELYIEQQSIKKALLFIRLWHLSLLTQSADTTDGLSVGITNATEQK